MKYLVTLGSVALNNYQNIQVYNEIFATNGTASKNRFMFWNGAVKYV